ncbi:MAG: RNA-directed DNA polymerase [Methanosphaera stadtmanae]|nr:RNA-directed DNA polymerase [Methanosphaera stadtmanae]
MPSLLEITTRSQGAVIFTRLVFCSAYNLIRIKEGQEYITAFRTPIWHFEYLVMPFGLRNAPSIFQRFVQDIFSNVIGVYVQIYIDQIIIYSKNEEHVKQVSYVLLKLIKNRLFAKLEKCDLHVLKTKFLGFIVSAKGLTMKIN